MATTKPRSRRCVCADLDVSLSWPDVVDLMDDYGLTPDPVPPPHVGEEAMALRDIHRRWIIRSGVDSRRRYVMPLRTVYATLLDDLAHLPRGRAGLEARRVLVDGLNDPVSGLCLARQPGLALRHAAS